MKTVEYMKALIRAMHKAGGITTQRALANAAGLTVGQATTALYHPDAPNLWTVDKSRGPSGHVINTYTATDAGLRFADIDAHIERQPAAAMSVTGRIVSISFDGDSATIVAEWGRGIGKGRFECSRGQAVPMVLAGSVNGDITIHNIRPASD